MAKKFRRMSDSDISSVVSELDHWALGDFGSKLTWSILEQRFGFSRQSLQAKSQIKAAYGVAKKSLSGGLVKTREQATKQNDELLIEISRLRLELEAYERKEELWLKRWQQIAFHIRQKGMQMSSVDNSPPKGSDLLCKTEALKILKPFDKDIPSSGRQ